MDDLNQHIIIYFKMNHEKYDSDMINNVCKEVIENIKFKKKCVMILIIL